MSGPGSAADHRLIVALDVPTIEEARRLVAALDGVVGFYKIGMWLMFEPGADAFVTELIAAGLDVFLDYKLHDIGGTVRAGTASVARRGARFLTVHAEPQVMRAAMEGAAGSALGILAVTVLTSLDDAALRDAGYGLDVAGLVARRVRAAAAAGCAGVIASAADDPHRLKEWAGRPMLVVTPGIRLPGDDQGDQKRVVTPAQAIRAGADHIVVGRPIVRAPAPREAALRVMGDLRA